MALALPPVMGRQSVGDPPSRVNASSPPAEASVASAGTQLPIALQTSPPAQSLWRMQGVSHPDPSSAHTATTPRIAITRSERIEAHPQEEL